MVSASFPATIIITNIKDETQDVKTFTLATKDGSILPCKAGQFLTFSFIIGGKEERRSYSISSSPALNEPLTITVKRVENGAFSRWLIDRAKVGDSLQYTGVAGLFTLPEALPTNTILLFAAGIGITPIYALLKELLGTTTDYKAVLIYSNRNEAETVFRNELLALEENSGSRLKIEWIFSDNKWLTRARLTRSLMDELLDKYLSDAERAYCYICGPTDYRWLVQLLLEEAGVAPVHIRQEIFVIERNIQLQSPPDKEKRQVSLFYQGNNYEFEVQYPETILAAAKRVGIALPYSCEAGRCSSCAMRCTEGEVWMSYNEVLTEKELLKGWVLTCTGYPNGSDLTLTL